MIETIPRSSAVLPPKTYPKGRRCNSCDKFLSIYNGRTRCAQCRPEGRTLAPLDKQSEVEAFLDVIRELMEQET